MILIISLLLTLFQPSATVDVHDSTIPVTKPFDNSPDGVRAFTHRVSRNRGYSPAQWKCLDKLITRESHWHHNSANGKHYGLGQVANMKKGTAVPKQLDVIFKYIKHRYGNSCIALRHSYRYQWY